MPEAITAFLEGTDFEDVIRTAVSLGGDCDTLTCIAGGVAEAFYGVPEEMQAGRPQRLRRTCGRLALLKRLGMPEIRQLPQDKKGEFRLLGKTNSSFYS